MRISDWSSDVCSSDLQKNIQNPEKILPFMRHKVSYLGGVRIPSFQKRLDELNALQGAQQKTTDIWNERSEEHTSELQSLMRISYAVFCLKKKNIQPQTITPPQTHALSQLLQPVLYHNEIK